MPAFTVEIPEDLFPAIVAEYSIVSSAGATTAATPEEYFAASVVETVRQRAETYKVGPYYVGPVDPQFGPDGMPYGWEPPVDPEAEGEDPEEEESDPEEGEEPEETE